MFSFFGGGLGGNPETDGLNHGNNPISMATIPPAEILEASYPVMFTQWALRPDSAGAGLHRGGLGAIYEIEALAAGGADVFLLGERGRYPAVRRQRRRRGGAEPLHLGKPTMAKRVPPLASKVTDVKISTRPAREAGDAGRRRLGRSARRAIPRASPATSGSATSRRLRRANDYRVVLDSGRRARCRGDARACARESGRMSCASAIVGVDVGGTFTDSSGLTSRATLCDRQGPSQRGDEAAGFIKGLRALGPIANRLDRAWHDGRHQRAAGAQGRAGRRDHDAGLSRRAGNAPPRPAANLGPVGRFHADRRSRHAHRGRRARPGGRHYPRERRSGGSREAARALLAKGARRSRSFSSTPMPIPPTNARRRLRREPSGPTRTYRASHEILPEIREFERASTTALNAYLQPVVGTYLEKLGRARSRARPFSGQFHIVQSNGGVHVDGDRAPVSGPHRAVRARRRRHRRRRDRARGGLSPM